MLYLDILLPWCMIGCRMRKPGFVLIALFILVAVIGVFGCGGEETTPTSIPAPRSPQLSTIELAEPYLLPERVVKVEFEVYVDGVLWNRVEKLSDFGPNDKVYEVVEDSEGRSSIRFGDGEHGSRLPSRSSRVVAIYLLGGDAGVDVPGASPSPTPASIR